MNHLLEYTVIVVYLLFLFAIGFVFRRFNSNISDYFRGGCRGTWWLVGTSMLMAGVSGNTFTGNAGIAFEAGWSILWVYVGTLVGLIICTAFLAAWFRQLRAITFPEVIRERYGEGMQQFYAYTGVFFQVMAAATQLWALAIFCSAVFGIDRMIVIPVIGGVVLFYSLTGGSWAVMATDFVQSLVMFPMMILVTILCLVKLGGMGGLFEAIEVSGLREDFAPVKPLGEHPANAYAWGWILAVMFGTLTHGIGLNSSPRFFACKDGREARKAAALQIGLLLVGMVIWFIPPMAARILWADDVLAQTGLQQARESAYAVASMKVLPDGLIGLMVVAMFSATMSSMDTGLNRNAALVVRDIYPPIQRLLRIPDWGDRAMLFLSRCVTLFFGLLLVGLSMSLAHFGKDLGVFQLTLIIGALLGTPMGIPLFMGVFVKRVPRWSGFFSMGVSFIFSAWAFLAAKTIGPDNALHARWVTLSGLPTDHNDTVPMLMPFAAAFDWPTPIRTLFEGPWTIQQQVLIIASAGILAYLFTKLFWHSADTLYRTQADNFFRKMRTPVDFEKEVGGENDLRQLKVMGFFSSGIGGFVCLLTLLPNSWSDRFAIACVGGFVVFVGLLMLWAERHNRRKRARLGLETVDGQV